MKRNEKKHEAKINPKHEARNSKQIQNTNALNSKQKQVHTMGNVFVLVICYLVIWICFEFRISDFGFSTFSVCSVYSVGSFYLRRYHGGPPA